MATQTRPGHAVARIDFAFGASDRLRMACDVVHKHYSKGRRLIVYCTDPALLERFDTLLWGFEATAFVPHVYSDDSLADGTPVLLSSTPVAPAQAAEPAWLVNLDEACPPHASGYARVLEIVAQDEASVLAARQRWRQYKLEGHELHAHDVSHGT